MIDLYTADTPNGRKISIMLEELGAEYTVHEISFRNMEQFTPEFTQISPNNKIPAIVDRDNGIAIMESGAILIYLAEKYGKFLPTDPARRMKVIEWLMWQVGGLGPYLGQAHHFLYYFPGKSAFAEERYAKEAQRLYGVLDRRLEGREFMVDDYSIADIATWPWISRFERQRIHLPDFPNVRRWYRALSDRPAVRKGFFIPHTTDTFPEG